MVIIDYLALGIGSIGVVVISWGVLLAVLRLVELETHRIKGKDLCRPREVLRHHLGSYLLLGLEFLIAADIVHTVIKPELSEMAILGSIVAIRTVLNYFLNKEVAAHTCAN